jgi:hypothetical protein
VVLLVVIVCLTVAMVLGALVVKMAALERLAGDAQLRSTQAEWLAESGIERAAARLAANPEYAGETWSIPPAALAEGGLVRIVVAPSPGEPGRRVVRVEAEYPNDPQYHCRCGKRVEIGDRGQGTGDRVRGAGGEKTQ